MKLTQNFRLEEFLVSETAARFGIDNTPTHEVIDNLKRLASVLEDVRARLGKPIIITSGYRSPALNAVIPGSSRNSMHQQGLAVDFISPTYGTPYEICKAISETNIEFDQLIHEFGNWVHFGLSNEPPRKQLLTAKRGSVGTIWEKGINA